MTCRQCSKSAGARMFCTQLCDRVTPAERLAEIVLACAIGFGLSACLFFGLSQ